MGNYVDPETGELLTQEAFDEKYAPSFPPPWPQFRQELEARLAPDPDAEIRLLNLPHYDPEQVVRPVFVSRMPNRKVSGAAHKEAIRSGKLPGYSIVKTALTDLKLGKEGEIKDYYNPSSDRLLYEALQERLRWRGSSVTLSPRPRWISIPMPSIRTKKPPAKPSSRGWISEQRWEVMYDYMRALQGQFSPESLCIEQQNEVVQLHRSLEAKLDCQQQIQLLELMDAGARLMDDVALASFIAGFRLASGIAKELEAAPSCSLTLEAERLIYKAQD